MLPCIPQGFRVAGVHCGIKQDSSKEDLTLIVADAPCAAAAVYTQNVVVAAPVVFNRRYTPCDNLRVVVVNSGNANSCTGKQGLQDAEEMARKAAETCGPPVGQSLVMSTGIIGTHLPMAKISAGIQHAASQLADDENALRAAAQGIMTTDKSHKIAGRELAFGQHALQITGIAKGAGMIGPNMATMLAIIMTDALLTPASSQRALQKAVDVSFNCISVEGHTSTNDSVLLLASGQASTEPLGPAEEEVFQSGLEEVCIELAKMIPDDGEGASHLVTVNVRGCTTREDAHRIARSVANSNLVKTGVAGADPNWGRIVSAAGYAGVSFNPDRLRLWMNGTLVFQDGGPVPFDERALSDSLRQQRETQLDLEFQEGEAQVRFWASDLTEDYVRFNSDYTS
jgi:glutamate N-acetyltransferase/amino-acid N-acetyltransferase